MGYFLSPNKAYGKGRKRKRKRKEKKRKKGGESKAKVWIHDFGMDSCIHDFDMIFVHELLGYEC